MCARSVQVTAFIFLEHYSDRRQPAAETWELWRLGRLLVINNGELPERSKAQQHHQSCSDPSCLFHPHLLHHLCNTSQTTTSLRLKYVLLLYREYHFEPRRITFQKCSFSLIRQCTLTRFFARESKLSCAYPTGGARVPQGGCNMRGNKNNRKSNCRQYQPVININYARDTMDGFLVPRATVSEETKSEPTK